MADISSMTLPDGSTYNVKDETARSGSGLIEMTKAQYDVLSSAEKNDGKVRFITDVNLDISEDYRTAAAQDIIDAAQDADIASRVKADEIGIVIDGNSTSVGASVGQYVIVRNSTITSITDGLYTATQAIPANTEIDATYLVVVSNGGFNSLSTELSTQLSTQLGKFGKILYSGNFSGSGRISVPGIGDYALVGFVPAAGSGSYTLIGSPWRGGIAFGTYNSTGVSHFAYRFNYVDNNTIEINSLNRGITDGTNTTYSGHADCKITRIIGLIPHSY